jgi:hypothetical protein
MNQIIKSIETEKYCDALLQEQQRETVENEKIKIMSQVQQQQLLLQRHHNSSRLGSGRATA